LYLETLSDFKKLIERNGLPTMCLSYDTTFDMGDYYVSVLTYRQTEFEEMPVVPLIFMLHMDRLQCIHEFFFSRVAELIPQIAESKKVIIVTDAEKAITNAILQTWPNIPMFRCWIHAWKNMKHHLTKIGIREKSSVSTYKSDFVQLLLQKSERLYKSLLAKLYLKSWNQVIYSHK
jgi:hypothetical protein